MAELDALRQEVAALRQQQAAADQERAQMIAQITTLTSQAPTGPNMAAVLQGLQDLTQMMAKGGGKGQSQQPVE